MSEAVNSKTRQARRFSAGLAACVVATIGIAILASPGRDTGAAPVDYVMPAEQVYVDGISATDLQAPASGHGVLGQAKTYLQRLSETGDARYLRYAKASMRARPESESGSVDSLILEARTLQAEHHFEAAAEILERATTAQPRSGEAWLLLSDTFRRSGRIPSARSACFQLALNGHSTLAQWCGLQLLQSTGDERQAYEISQALLSSADQLPASARAWALEIAAEAAVAVDRPHEAADLYDRALRVKEPSLALRLAYADLLLDEGRFSEVESILEHDTLNTSALVRIVVAQKRSGGPVNTAMKNRLETSFANASKYADHDTSFRDQAIWALEFYEDPQAALEFAKRNWSQQKGSEDRALLHAVAMAAGDSATIAELEAWLSESALADKS